MLAAGTIHDHLGELAKMMAELRQELADIRNQVKELTDSVVEIVAARAPEEKSGSRATARGD